MACLNYRPSVVHFKKGQGGLISGANRGDFFCSEGWNFQSESNSLSESGFLGIYVSDVQFRDGKLMLPLFGLKRVGQKSGEKKGPQEVLG